MTTNNDLDSFFRKKDRKEQKHKKQTGLLTNNEELLKQLKNVTSAQREYADFEEDFDEVQSNSINVQPAVVYSSEVIENSDVKSNSTKTKANNKFLSNEKEEIKTNNQQQEEWEDYEESIDKLEELRLKLTGNHGERSNDDDDDDFFEEQYENSRENRFESEKGENIDRSKEKTAWKLEEIKFVQNETKISAEENLEKISAKVEPTKTNNSTGVYRPPHARNSGSVTIIAGSSQRKTNKEKPNIASTEEFPTLAGAIKKSS